MNNRALYRKMNYIVSSDGSNSYSIPDDERKIIEGYVEDYYDYVRETHKMSYEEKRPYLANLLGSIDKEIVTLYSDVYSFILCIERGESNEVISIAEHKVIEDYFKLDNSCEC